MWLTFIISFGSYIYPTFNIADSLLVAEVILFCFDLLFLEHKELKKTVR